jgi:acyl-CoA synthetase (AMP-forming)/AMP-acid ligase II
VTSASPANSLIPLTLNEVLRQQVADRADKIALKFESESYSYRELDERAAQVARGLIAEGVGPGDRVAYLGKNSLAYFEYFLGAMKARAVTVPLNWRLAAPEVSHVLTNARPKVILVESSFVDNVAKAAPNVARLISGRTEDTFAAWRDSQSRVDYKVDADWNEPVLQLYTSGTTGRPKGAVLTHRNLLGLRHAAPQLPVWYQWSAADVSLVAMPVSHISGTGWALWTLQHGATGVIVSEFDPRTVFELLVENRINKVIMVPTAMQIAARHPRARATDFSFLKYLYYGGAPLRVELLEECAAVFGCGFVQMYGMTETSGSVVALSPEDHSAAGGARLSSVGTPLPGVELKVTDASGRALPAGITGEILIRSCSIMRGYFEMPEATAATIDDEGWLRSGDAGFLDSEGYLYLQDRIKDLIISGGENIYPAEVESAIASHPGVVDVAVIGISDDKWGEVGKAVIVPVTGSAPSADEIIAWAAERIAKFKLPKSVEFVDALPRNHTGKILRRELRDRYGSKAR